MLDAVRYELLRRSLQLGLVSSSFSITGLDFLWSPGFLSIFDGKFWLPSKMELCLVITICCCLMQTVGPASALLLIPTATWLEAGHVQYYLGGTEDQLWPSRLTMNHTGPSVCQRSPMSSLSICPFGGLQTLALEFQADGARTGFEILLEDNQNTRHLWGHSPTYIMSAPQQQCNETFALTARSDVGVMMNDLDWKYDIARSFATGRNKRLNDFLVNRLEIAQSKVPTGRAVCGPFINLVDASTTIPFPVLAQNQPWRGVTTTGSSPDGDLLNISVKSLPDMRCLSTLNCARAKWITLPDDFGAASAGVAFVSSNATYAVARGCTVDANWATGQTYRQQYTLLRAFMAHAGKQGLFVESRYSPRDPTDFFDPAYHPWYGNTIVADQDWLDTVFPVYNGTTQAREENLTIFETLLQPLLADPALTVSTDNGVAWTARTNLEYVSMRDGNLSDRH